MLRRVTLTIGVAAIAGISPAWATSSTAIPSLSPKLRAEATALARRADNFARQRRENVNYINMNHVSQGVRVIVQTRPRLSAFVPDVNRSSDGETSYRGRRYLYSYRTLPSRGLLLLRLERS